MQKGRLLQDGGAILYRRTEGDEGKINKGVKRLDKDTRRTRGVWQGPPHSRRGA
jgi:hypothetical protein